MCVQTLDTTRRSLEYSIYEREREIAATKLDEIDKKRGPTRAQMHTRVPFSCRVLSLILVSCCSCLRRLCFSFAAGGSSHAEKEGQAYAEALAAVQAADDEMDALKNAIAKAQGQPTQQTHTSVF